MTDESRDISYVTSPPRRSRLLILADAAAQREGLAGLLAPIADGATLMPRSLDALREIGIAAGDARRHVATALATGLDAVVVVLDDAAISVAETLVYDGLAALAALGVPVVLLIADTDDNVGLAAAWLTRDVRAVLPLDASPDELAAALHAAIVGLTTIDPHVASALAAGGFRVPRNQRRSALTSGQPPALTTREREVLALLAAGHATKTIARDLEISAHTVKAHVESIFEKLGATTRAEAVAIGVRRGAVML